MKKPVLTTRCFLRDEEGVTAIEYGLIAALIAIVIVGVLLTVGQNLSNLFAMVGNCLTNAINGTSC